MNLIEQIKAKINELKTKHQEDSAEYSAIENLLNQLVIFDTSKHINLSDVDRKITTATETAITNWKEKHLTEEVEKLHNQKFPPQNPLEAKVAELERKLEEKSKSEAKNLIVAEAKRKADEKGLKEFIDVIKFDSIEEAETKISQLNDFIDIKVKERLIKENGRDFGGDNESQFTDALKKYGGRNPFDKKYDGKNKLELQAKIFKENPALFNYLKRIAQK